MPLAPQALELTFLPSLETRGTTDAFLWTIFATSFLPVAYQALRYLQSTRQLGWIVGIAGLGLAIRSSLELLPLNWYMGIDGVPAEIFTRPTTRMALISRLVLLDWHFGIDGIRVLNVAAGSLAVPLLGFATLRAGHPARAARIFTAFLACSPFFAKLSASEGGYPILLLLYASGAAAHAILAEERHRWSAYALLATSVALAVPIRLESGPLLLSIPLLFCRDGIRLRDVLWRGLPTVVLGAAWAVGMATSLQAHGTDVFRVQTLGRPGGIVTSALSTALSALFLPNPIGRFFTPLYVIPVWIKLHRVWRERAWKRLIPMYIGLPFFWLPPPGLQLPSDAYLTLRLLLVLLPCAVAWDELWTRCERRPWRVGRLGRAAVLAALAPALYATFVWPFGYTYAYQEEFRFLRDVLPRTPATVLTIFDAGDRDFNGDFDCCLSAPHPLLYAEYPNLRWIVLRRSDLETQAYRHLAFDYYYPGALTRTDPDAVGTWIVNRLAVGLKTRLERWGIPFDPKLNGIGKQVAFLHDLHALDRAIREEYGLAPVVTRQVPARTFSSGRFAGDAMELALYRERERTRGIRSVSLTAKPPDVR